MTEKIRVLEQLGQELEQAVRAPRRRRLRQALFAQRWRTFVLVGVVCLGGTTAALAAAGVFASGSPVAPPFVADPSAYDGAVNPTSVQLLSLAVPDPRGGPPWGLRLEQTSRGLTCLQYGRLDHGMIGYLGIDDAFEDDGRFHPLTPGVDNQGGLGCATTDAQGYAFLTVTMLEMAASGTHSCHGDATSLFADLPHGLPGDPARIFQRLAERDLGPICPPSQLRNLYYGMLGPDALSITYPGAYGRPLTERTSGPDGAYLVLGPPTAVLCHPLGSCSNGDTQAPSLHAGFIRSVTYRNGYVCHIDRLQAQQQAHWIALVTTHFPALAGLAGQAATSTKARAAYLRILTSPAYLALVRANGNLQAPASCPTLGYAAPPATIITHAQVASPVRVRARSVGLACVPSRRRRRCGRPQVRFSITFRARVAVTDIDSHYEVTTTFTPTHATATGPCAGGGGSFGSTPGNLRAGQLVHYSDTEPASCPGVIHGKVVYAADDAPSTDMTIPGLPGQSSGVLVGTFSFGVR